MSIKKIDLWVHEGYIFVMKRHFMKTEFVKVRVTGLEKQAFQEAADMAGVALSAWIRERLRRMAIKELEEAGKKIAFLQTALKDF